MAGSTSMRRSQAKGGLLQNRHSAEANDVDKSTKKQVSEGESDSGSPPDTDHSQPDFNSAGDNGSTASVSAMQRPDNVNSGTSRGYESPMKRVRRAMILETCKCVIDTACALKSFIIQEDPTGRGVPSSVASTIALRLRVVWISFEMCSTGPVARLHLTDKCESAGVEEMHEVFKEDYTKKKSIVDSELVTASLYGVDETAAAGLPGDGTIIYISKVWALKLFANHSCQLSTSIDAIKVET